VTAGGHDIFLSACGREARMYRVRACVPHAGEYKGGGTHACGTMRPPCSTPCGPSTLGDPAVWPGRLTVVLDADLLGLE
jgi:hypothetical protein